MLDDVQIVIPSSGRPTRQITLTSFPWGINVYVAMPVDEVDNYVAANNVIRELPVPNRIKGISKTRQWLMENCKHRYLLMLDDDMVFFHRPNMKSPKLLKLKHIDVLLAAWHSYMNEFAHVGLSARQGNNNEVKEIATCRRMFNAYMYDMKVINKVNPVLGRLPVMEDFDLTLQLLRAGYPNGMIYKWCWNQSGSNAEGGCSQYRTNKMQAAAARKLAELHPGFVKVVEKQSKNWQGMETRLDVRVQWAKAYKNSQSSKAR